MNRKRIVILIVIFLLLGTYVYFYEIGKGDKKDQPPDKVKVFDIASEDVLEIIIKKDDQNVTLRLVGGQWKIEKPGDANIANQKVYDLVSVFDYGIVRVIDDNSTDLTQYGFDKATVEFWIKTKGDDSFKILIIGGDSPGGISCYAKVKGQTKILLLGILYRQELERALINFSQAPDAK